MRHRNNAAAQAEALSAGPRRHLRKTARLLPLCIGAAAAAGFVLTAGAAGAVEELPRSLARTDPATFAGKTRLIDDPLEPHIEITTRPAHPGGRKLNGARGHDIHLRALIDRRDGAVHYEVVHDISYWGPPRDFRNVHFAHGGRLIVRGVHMDFDGREACEADTAIGQCRAFNVLRFPLSQHEVRAIADRYRQGSRAPWKLRFKAVSGKDVTSGIAPAEAAGLLLAVGERGGD